MANSSSKNKKKGGLKKVCRNRPKCRYCGNSRPQSDMTTIPTNSGQLSAWIQILGPEFAENIKIYKSNYICMSHIENEDRGPYRLPKNIHNITLVNSKPKVKKTSKWEKGGYYKCRYCGISRPSRDMTSVPSVPEQLSKWIEILGPNFAENIKKFKCNFICLNHIEHRSRGHDRLPKRMDNIPTTDDDDEFDEGQTEKEIKKDDRNVEMVPSKADEFENDSVTGDDEEEQTPKTRRVNNGKNAKRMKKITVNDMTSSEDEMEKKEDEEVIKEQNKEIEKNNEKRSEKIAKRGRTDYTFGIDDVEEEDDGDVAKEQNKVMEKETQEYEEWENPEMWMTSNPIEMETESNSNSKNSSQTIVDPNHDIVEMRTERSEEFGSGSIAIIDQIDTEEQIQEMEVEDRDCVEMVPPKQEEMEVEKKNNLNIIIVKSETEGYNQYVEMVPPKCDESESDVLSNNLNVTNANSSNENIQCRVCGKHFNRVLMTETPADFEKTEEWIRILGSEFHKNIVTNSPPHFICIEDLRKMVP